ncbi:EscV/YscV/HrcV family type III secretion system export apparatus protein [Rouxiella chamberiensis]|uniref:EscV/YscV/HrcV family type III secretion system export apparatus protein n=2 Tax=Rouxiella chamberiensis TaxID=1513468 RepID=A0ABY7HUF1_9GAMM|nr:EscV/YscV/HrcV family type III secretion system export apparatus protein [Rouxiella chamberiensis]WAT03043.1 EscV/YscV/HrcV family type III secretion system export apparatus protein [Rouxiella chamberiensis]
MLKMAAKIKEHPELIILLLMVTIIAMLIVPLPTYLVDFLIGLNIVISMLVFLSSFYISGILSFSTFPAVLLITTLFRLSLSISTSRLILNDANAGEIIETFGLYVIGDNLVVGFVIFFIVTITQFMVITKGAERVAEVAARFSLDAMPGKQMSIDADVKTGILDSDQAKERRSILERESQLYGSFDGAMKFIKGDAIAGIIIIFVNFIGGISVGMNQHGMTMSEALKTYTMLTIGDGLVAQIPSLLIAVSAGFIVTRVSGEGDNMGRKILSQLINQPFVIAVAAILTLGVGLLPGFPLFVFVTLSLMLCATYFYKRQIISKKAHSHKGNSAEKAIESGAVSTGLESVMRRINHLDETNAEALPLILVLPDNQFNKLQEQDLAGHIRSQFFIDYGIHLPDILLQSAKDGGDHSVTFLINEIKVETYNLHFDKLRVINKLEELELLNLTSYKEISGVWVEKDQRENLTSLGYSMRTAIDELYFCISLQLSHHINEFFGVQEAKSMSDRLEQTCPELIKEVLRHMTMQKISEILQRLLSERISIRNMKMIMEALALWAPKEKDVILLVEHVRGTLARYICNKFSINNQLRVIMVTAETEDVFRSGIRTTSGGSFLNIEPAAAEELMDTFTVALQNYDYEFKDIVIISSVDIRRFIKKFIETRFKDIAVMSYGELSQHVNVDVIQTI